MRIGSHRFGARGNPTPRAIQRTLTNNGLARCSHGRYTSHAPRHRSHSVFRERLHVGGWFAFVALTVGAALIAVSAIELLARRMDRSRRHARRALNVCCYCVHSDSKRLIRRHCAVMVTARGRTEPGHDASGQRCCRNCEPYRGRQQRKCSRTAQSKEDWRIVQQHRHHVDALLSGLRFNCGAPFSSRSPGQK
jgi:hypothetical protein